MSAVDVEVLASGYRLAEAPRADGSGRVFFSDPPGGGVFCWSEADGVVTVVPKRRGVGGMALHADGGVVVSGRDVRHVRAGTEDRVLVEAGDGITGFNDLCALPDGALLVGCMRFNPLVGEQPVPSAFFRCDGSVREEWIAGIEFPNGCGVSPDGSVAYACNYASGEVFARDRAGARLFGRTPAGEADGLAVDRDGGVWLAQPRAASIVRLTPEGKLDRTLALPGHFVTSLEFDGDALYLTTASSGQAPEGALLRVRAPVPGPRHLLARI